ncbi:MAG: hypothetical protein ACRCZP_16335 [Phycicoccus sp.]
MTDPTITFRRGMASSAQQVYTVPSDTRDPRWAACADHHPACDCREAEHAEDIHDYRARLRGIDQAALKVLRGHATYAVTADGQTDYARRCQCTGCQIARCSHEIRSLGSQHSDGVPVYRPEGWEPPL